MYEIVNTWNQKVLKNNFPSENRAFSWLRNYCKYAIIDIAEFEIRKQK